MRLNVSLVKCRGCGKPLGNPLTHVCVSRAGSRQRKVAAAGLRTPVPSGNAHEYTTCGDDDCQKFPCRVYKEGYGDGHSVGYGAGHADGYGAGYGDGHAEGAADGT